MSLTTRQRLQVGVTLATLVAAGAGGVLLTKATAPNAPLAASQTAAGPVYIWPATIAVDTQTGQLQSGFVNPRFTAARKGLYYCPVATETLPVRKRVLLSSVVSPQGYNTACQSAFQQWDSAETLAPGRWPNP